MLNSTQPQQGILLVRPSKIYLKSYTQAYDEYIEAKTGDEIGFTNPHTTNVLLKAQQYRDGVVLPQGYVPSTTLWLVNDGRFIGEVHIRHYLNDALNLYGGHIGYTVRLCEQNKGYGSQMLSMALNYCRTIGLDKVMITCNDENTASARVIEKNNGILQDKITNKMYGKTILTRRYWITL